MGEAHWCHGWQSVTLTACLPSRFVRCSPQTLLQMGAYHVACLGRQRGVIAGDLKLLHYQSLSVLQDAEVMDLLKSYAS